VPFDLFVTKVWAHPLKKSDLEQPRKLEICGQLEGDWVVHRVKLDLAIWQNNKVSHLSLFGSLRSQWTFPTQEHPLGTQ
jgi:hypothetical protein